MQFTTKQKEKKMRNYQRSIIKGFVSAIFVMGFCGGTSHAISLTQSTDATTLINSILGPGITIVGTPIYTGVFNQSGTFTNASTSGLGFDEGIVLSTGNINQIPGPNNNSTESLSVGNTLDDDVNMNLGTGGDSDLTAIVGIGTNDAAVLEFDFQFGDGTGGDNSLFFNYSFASEEYIDFVDSTFNDIFAFLLDGSNIALVPPLSGTPVSINTVNPNLNSDFYINNVPNANGLGNAGLDLSFDGLTTGLFAQAINLGAGTHTIKLAIADTSDSFLDSAVFIQGGTFSNIHVDPPESVPEPGTILLLGSGLVGLVLVRPRKKKVSGQ